MLKRKLIALSLVFLMLSFTLSAAVAENPVTPEQPTGFPSCPYTIRYPNGGVRIVYSCEPSTPSIPPTTTPPTPGSGQNNTNPPFNFGANSGNLAALLPLLMMMGGKKKDDEKSSSSSDWIIPVAAAAGVGLIGYMVGKNNPNKKKFDAKDPAGEGDKTKNPEKGKQETKNPATDVKHSQGDDTKSAGAPPGPPTADGKNPATPPTPEDGLTPKGEKAPIAAPSEIKPNDPSTTQKTNNYENLQKSCKEAYQECVTENPSEKDGNSATDKCTPEMIDELNCFCQEKKGLTFMESNGDPLVLDTLIGRDACMLEDTQIDWARPEEPDKMPAKTVCEYIASGRIKPEDIEKISGDTLKYAMEEDVSVAERSGENAKKSCSDIICGGDKPSKVCLEALNDPTPAQLQKMDKNQMLRVANADPSKFDNQLFRSEFDSRLPGNADLLHQLNSDAEAAWSTSHGLNQASNLKSITQVGADGLITTKSGTQFYPNEWRQGTTTPDGLMYHDNVHYSGGQIRRDSNTQQIWISGEKASASVPKGSPPNNVHIYGSNGATINRPGTLQGHNENIQATDAKGDWEVYQSNIHTRKVTTGRATAALEDTLIIEGNGRLIMTSPSRETPIFFTGAIALNPDHDPTLTDLDILEDTYLEFPVRDYQAIFYADTPTNFHASFNEEIQGTNKHDAYVDYDATTYSFEMKSAYASVSDESFSEITLVGNAMVDIEKAVPVRFVKDDKVHVQGSLNYPVSTQIIYKDETPKFYDSIFNSKNFPDFDFNDFAYQSTIGATQLACSSPSCERQIEVGMFT